MKDMFYGCFELREIQELDTSNCLNTQSMFRDCSSLVSLPDLDLSKVENADNMLSFCFELVTDIPSWKLNNDIDLAKLTYQAFQCGEDFVKSVGIELSVKIIADKNLANTFILKAFQNNPNNPDNTAKVIEIIETKLLNTKGHI